MAGGLLEKLCRYRNSLRAAAKGLLLLPLLPGIGRRINGARIWIHLGPMSFQPGEIAKLLLVIAFAGYLVVHRDSDFIVTLCDELVQHLAGLHAIRAGTFASSVDLLEALLSYRASQLA